MNAAGCNHVLSTSVGGELWALEQDLEGLPNIRSGGVRAVDDVGAVGEPCGDRLIDIDHYVIINTPDEIIGSKRETNCC